MQDFDAEIHIREARNLVSLFLGLVWAVNALSQQHKNRNEDIGENSA